MSHAVGSQTRWPVRIDAPIASDIRLALRPLTCDDRDAYIVMVRRSRKALDRWAALHMEGESDDALFERQLALCTEGDRTGHAWRRVGVLDDGRLAGTFNLNAISRGLTWRADANWWVDSDLAGRGLATQGVRMLIAHAAADLPEGLGLHTVEAGIAQDNAPSIRVAQKAGFVRMGDERVSLRTGGQWALYDLYAWRATALT